MIHRYTFTILFILSVSLSFGQSRMAVPRDRGSKDKAGQVTVRKAGFPSLKETNRVRMQQKAGFSNPGTTDTLNYPLEGEYSLYAYGGGFVSGTNGYNDRVKANIFSQGAPSLLKGVLIDFAVASSSDIDIEIAAWDNKGTGGLPGNKIASATIPIDDIFIDILNNQTTYIPFEQEAVMPSNFYLGVVLPSGGDTLALYTNTDGDTDPATAWEQWENYQWHRYDEEESWVLKVSHAIFPVVDNGLLSYFSAEPTTVGLGGNVSFHDSSVGEPVTWEWHFEGGTPASSAVQHPVVTYDQEGLYDVTLIVGDGATFDTLTREDYILVTNETPTNVDTLNYPLEGIYTVYIITDGVTWGGYVCGTNYYHDLAKANYFSVTDDFRITGLLVDFVIASGGNPDIEFVVWNNDGTAGGPGTKLKSKTVELNTIKSDIANNMPTYVSFYNPVNLNHAFYAGFVLPTATSDTLVVWCNEDGITYPGIAWDKWEDGNWVALADPISYNLNIAMAIHPIIEYQTGVHETGTEVQIPVFPNPSNGKFWVDLTFHSPATLVEVMDLQGNMIWQLQVKPGRGQVEVDLADYPAGIYLLRVTGDGYSALKKIILN